MLKFILFFLLSLSLNTFAISPQNQSKFITITVVDSLSNERLAGVKIRRGNTIHYSDLNGQVKIEKMVYNNKLSVSLISYKEKTDTISKFIYLNKI